MLTAHQKELEILKRRLQREISSRKQAEAILEQKALELYQANQELVGLNELLNQRITERTLELEDTELRYRQIVETASDIIYRADANGYFTYANPVATALLGYTYDEIIGRHFMEFIHPDQQDWVNEHYKHLRETMELKSYLEIPVVTKSGEVLWLGQSVQFIVKDGEIIEAASVARDITARKATEDDLLSTKLRLTTLISNMQSSILVEDENRRIVLTNERFCKKFEIQAPPEALVGVDCSNSAEQVMHLFNDPEKFVKRITTLLKNRELYVGEELRMKDGRILERDYIPIFAEGKYLGHLWQYRDLTDQKLTDEALRRSEEKYRGIMENMELGLLEVDNLGRIVKAYQGFCEMTGYSESDLLDRKANEVLLPPEFYKVMKQQTLDRMRGKAGVYEVQIFKKDGSRIWVMISGAPIYNQWGLVVGTIGIHYDITPQKRLQQELFVARLRAEETQEAEKQFLANMSHEIRTPLNAIIGMTHLLFDTSPSKEQGDYLNVLKSSADILQSLISDVLDLSKIRSGKLEPHPKEFDLKGLVNAMGKIFQRKLEGRPVQMEVTLDPAFRTLLLGDDLMLNQILLNLLGNAEKFTAEGKIGLRVYPVHHEGKWVTVRFEVFDSGIGIPQDRMDVIFQSFRQVDGDIKRRFGGTGLGLTIVKSLVEIQQGSIWVESTPGKGSNFIFEIPYTDTEMPVLVEKEPQLIKRISSEKELLVLVVEDNSMNRKYISSLLNKWDIRHKMAFDGREGFIMAKAERFDLIFLDIQMPVMDGYETAIAIRNSVNPNRATPLVALTASAMLSKKDKAFETGMDDYISKPFSPAQLLAVLKKHVNLEEEPQTQNGHASENGAAFASKGLDRAWLHEIYGDDQEYAADMFQAFFEKMEEEYPLLRATLEKGDFQQLSKLAHKLKPAFPLVGLTWLEASFQQLENEAGHQDAAAEHLEILLSNLEREVEAALPLVKHELGRLFALELVR